MNIPNEAINFIALAIDAQDIVDFINKNHKEFEDFLSNAYDRQSSTSYDESTY